MTIHTKDLFPAVYNEAFKSIVSHGKERYTFTGGRASGKSSFISLSIILLMAMRADVNVLIVRRYAKSLRQSVFEQIKWAINKLGIAGFRIPRSNTAALPITFTRPNGNVQTILFAGLDDPEKLKSLKVSNGYMAVLWVEEKTEVVQSSLHNLKISALRGKGPFWMFESFNPPSAARHWCNEEAHIKDHNRMIVHSTYLDMRKEWLGDALLHDIAHTKRTNKRAYENIYLGKCTGTGRNVFDNIVIRAITDKEIAAFDYVYCGIDWGFYPDPYAYGAMSYDSGKATLYIFDELYLRRASNVTAFDKTKAHMAERQMDIARQRITADSAEPKSIADFRSWGAAIRGAVKGLGSLEAGFKWLQGLDAIVIDEVRAPHMAAEFTLYEYEIDRNTGEVLEGYPQGQDDHGMALVRYAMESVWRHGGL